ncbi:MAG: hypothetical protein LBQ33_02160 [Oscillospiraceae bacterium]|jgi:hypothetical protein|nr:hypothetical protein [Oscillospiraceae bacterium]
MDLTPMQNQDGLPVGEGQPDDEKKEKKELLRSKVQALVASYEEEKRRNEELNQELERFRTAQAAAPQQYQPPQQGAVASGFPAHPQSSPPPQMPQYMQAPAMAQPPQQPQGVSAPGYTLQSFAPQQNAAPPQQLTAQHIAPQAEFSPAYAPYAPEREGAYAPRNPYIPAQQTQLPEPPRREAPPPYPAAYAPPIPSGYGAEMRSPAAPARTAQPFYAPQGYPQAPAYAAPAPAPGGYYRPPAAPSAAESAESLLFSMNRVVRRIEQVRARLRQTESIRGVAPYGYPQQPAFVEPETVSLLDQLYDELGDLSRELSQMRSVYR